jgi:hypothetical protein
VAWLEPEEAAVAAGIAYAPTEVGADPDYGTVRSEKRTLAARGTACRVRRRPWVARSAPERILTLEAKHRLRHVRLADDDGSRCAQRCDDLLLKAG